MSSPLLLSVIIPAFNEETRIENTLRLILKYLIQQSYSSEVLVIDDGSQDKTTQVVKSFCNLFAQQNISLRLLRNNKNRGKGYSVRHGFLASKGEIVLLSDADLSAPITEAAKLISPILDGECDVTFGSRALDSSYIKIHQSLIREMAGRVFNGLMRFSTQLDIADTQCGFKAFRRLLLKPVFQQQTIFGFGFDVEILYLASRRNARLREIPVIWKHVEGSKVGLIRDSVNMFFDLIRIYTRNLRGKYKVTFKNEFLDTCESKERSLA